MMEGVGSGGSREGARGLRTGWRSSKKRLGAFGVRLPCSVPTPQPPYGQLSEAENRDSDGREVRQADPVSALFARQV